MKLLKRLPVLASHTAPASATPRSHAPCQSGPRRILSLLPGSGGLATRLATFTAAILLGLPQVQAVDYHVTTAQELQNALSSAAANGADDNIYLAAGYYTGNFNFNSTENRSLLVQGEPGTTNTAISIDGAGTGRNMNMANTGTGNFTVRGITFLRNCGSDSIGALRIAGSASSTILLDTCRFLSPTNASAAGRGVEILSGQNATVTNCVVTGRPGGAGTGVWIAGLAGNVVVGGSSFATNGGNGGLLIGIASGASVQRVGTFSATGNNFTGNEAGACVAYITGGMTFVSNIVVGNGPGNHNGQGVALDVGNSLIVGNVVGNVFRNNDIGASFVCSYGNPLVLSNNVFVNNGGHGALLYPNSASGLTVVTKNTFTGNSGSGLRFSGNGINATITANTFTGNNAASASAGGGGLYCSNDYVTVSNNVFTGNSATVGGGLQVGGGSGGYPAIVTGNTFFGNSASGAGGGAYFAFSDGTALVSANVFRQNSASQGGGAIFATGPTVRLVDNLVVKNSQAGSGYKGGGIYVSPTSALTMVHNTVADNTTAGNGGGLAVSVSSTSEILDVYNNIIWGNSASGNGADVWLAGTGSKKTFLYNDVHGMYGVWDIAANLLDVAPAFFDPVNGDYHLRSTSPCINAGTNGAPSMPAFDLDGNTRTNGVYVDLGCYEFNNTVFHPADLNHDWVISLTEYTNYATAWKNSQAWSVAPPQIPADYVTRAGYLQNLGGTYHNDGAGAPLCWKTGP